MEEAETLHQMRARALEREARRRWGREAARVMRGVAQAW